MTAFKERSVALDFVEKRRAAIPYGADQIDVMLRFVRELVPEPKRIIDLGCGDGILASALLTAFPNSNALLVDNSKPMLERARDTMSEYKTRVELVHADLGDNLTAALAEYKGADIVVSGYAIHHLTHGRKQQLYKEIFELLGSGGMFINIEHVASTGACMEKIWDEACAEHTAKVQNIPYEKALRDHKLRPDKVDNILAPLDWQLGWLREIGFEHVDCYFKWFELAVFGGRKPN